MVLADSFPKFCRLVGLPCFMLEIFFYFRLLQILHVVSMLLFIVCFIAVYSWLSISFSSVVSTLSFSVVVDVSCFTE